MSRMSSETITRRAEARKEEKRLNALQSVAHLCKFTQTVSGQCLEIELNKHRANQMEQAEKIEFWGMDVVKTANEFLPKMGFRPVRLTRNILNPDSKTIVIDINTPSYCDPGCGAYHSM